jgi:PAS domain S-box-containing protein
MFTNSKYKLRTEKAKTIRKNKGYTLEQVAKYLEKTRQTISLWENGLRSPGKSEIILMARLYNVELEDIADIVTTDSDLINNAGENIFHKEYKNIPPDVKENILNLQKREKQLEKESHYLRNRNANLKSIINSINSLIYTKNSKNEFTYINDRYLETIGFLTHQVLGKNNHSIFNKNDADILTALENTVLQSGNPIIRHQIKIPGTNDLFGKINITPLYDSNEEITGISANIEDNTVEKDLQIRRALLEEITDNLEEFVWIRTIEPYKKLLYISKGAENLLNYKLYELFDSFEIWYKNIDKAQLKSIKKLLGKNKSTQITFKYLSKNGQVKWINYKKYIKKENGKTVEFGIAQDITSRKEEQIRREMLEFVITNSPYGEWLEEIQPDGTIENVYFNKAMARNWGRPIELLKRSSKFGWLKYLHPDDRKCRIKENINETRSTPVQFRVIHPDKTVKWLEEVYFVKKTKRGTLLRFGHQWDITDMKSKEEEN